MRNAILLLIPILFISCSILTTNKTQSEQYKIYKSNGNAISYDKMISELKNYDVVFFGELHDDKFLHKKELEILKSLSKPQKEFSISMEMFERDTQNILDAYLKNEISEDEFIIRSRAWPNYSEDYSPIIEFAKKESIDVIAANIPRRYAAMVNKKGLESLQNLPDEEKLWIAKDIKIIDNEYKVRFQNTLKKMMGIGQRTPPAMQKNLDNTYKAQCIKDDTMAESIYNYLKKNPGKKVIHFNGQFHSDAHLGTVEKLHLLNKNLKIAVITSINIPLKLPLDLPDRLKTEGDYIITYKALEEQNQETSPKIKSETSFIPNRILNHKLNVEIFPELNKLRGSDEIKFQNNIATTDTLRLRSSLKVTSISANGNNINFFISNNNKAYQTIQLFPHGTFSEIVINYEGKLYYDKEEVNLNNDMKFINGIISDQINEGIFLPRGTWYPVLYNQPAYFETNITCPNNYHIITSGRELKSTLSASKNQYYFLTENPTDNLTLIGNKFFPYEKEFDGKKFRAYLYPSDKKNALKIIDKLIYAYKTYKPLFGELPYRTFTLAEFSYSNELYYPGLTILSDKNLKNMPEDNLLRFSLLENWWGCSVIKNYKEGNWDTPLNLFLANYFWNDTHDNKTLNEKWKKHSIVTMNLLNDKNMYPLNKFYYQKNENALCGKIKGQFLFLDLYRMFGKDKFIETLQNLFDKQKGKPTTWTEIKSAFKENNINTDLDLDSFFNRWLEDKELSNIEIESSMTVDNQLDFTLSKNTDLPLYIPIKITTKNNKSYTKNIYFTSQEQKYHFEFSQPVKRLEIDHENNILKRISDEQMPFSIRKTLKNNPLIIIPSKGQYLEEIQQMCVSLKKIGFNIEVVFDKDLNSSNKWKNRNLLVIGSSHENSFYAKIVDYFKGDIKIGEGVFYYKTHKYDKQTQTLIYSFNNDILDDQLISIILWNSPNAIESIKDVFDYFDESIYILENHEKNISPIFHQNELPAYKNTLIKEF